MTPTLDAHLLNRLGLRADILRLPVFGLGCVGGGTGLARAADLYAGAPENSLPTTFTDTVAARSLSSPVQRAGVTLTGGWRRDTRRGLYATGRGTLLQTLNAGSSPLHDRLAQTLPSAFYAVEPDLVFWIAGADNHEGDRFGQMGLSTEAMRERDRFVLQLCLRWEVPLTVLYGGGYNRNRGLTAQLHANTVMEALRVRAAAF